jgi:hypothetical protein
MAPGVALWLGAGLVELAEDAGEADDGAAGAALAHPPRSAAASRKLIRGSTVH